MLQMSLLVSGGRYGTFESIVRRVEKLAAFDDHFVDMLVAVVLCTSPWITMQKEDVHSYSSLVRSYKKIRFTEVPQSYESSIDSQYQPPQYSLNISLRRHQ